MAILGGIGLEQALSLRTPGSAQPFFAFGRIRLSCSTAIVALSFLSAAAGIAALLVVAASYFLPAPFVNLAQRVVEGSDLAQAAFADGRMFWGYQSVGLARFGIAAAVSGLLLWLLIRRNRSASLNRETVSKKPRVAAMGAWVPGALPYAFIVALFLDLNSVHGSFNPATDAALSPLKNVPPVVQFINQKEGIGTDPAIGYAPFRFTTL